MWIQRKRAFNNFCNEQSCKNASTSHIYLVDINYSEALPSRIQNAITICMQSTILKATS